MKVILWILAHSLVSSFAILIELLGLGFNGGWWSSCLYPSLLQKALRDHTLRKKKAWVVKCVNYWMKPSRVCVCMWVCAILKTVSRRSCTAAPIYWWNISPMCRSRTQQFRTIKTYSPGPIPHRNMHKTHTLTHTRSLMHGYLHECTHTIYTHIL